MKDEELKERISKSSDWLIRLNIEETRSIKERTSFLSWILGLVSAGFLFFVSNMIQTQRYLDKSDPAIFMMIWLVLISFLLSVCVTVAYRLIAYRIIDKYSMNSNYLKIQADLLCDNLKLIPVNDRECNVLNLVLSSKLSAFEYLDDEERGDYRKETESVQLQRLNLGLFYANIVFFLIEYMGICFVLVKAYKGSLTG